MFAFGDPHEVARAYKDASYAEDGPEVANLPFEELSPEDQLNTFTYMWRAYRCALYDNADPRVVDLLCDEYDYMFMLLARAQPAFKENVNNNRHSFLPDHEIETVNKYRVLAGLQPYG